MLAIIGGSGLSQLAGLDITHREAMDSPYGAPSAPLVFGRVGSQSVVFLARHGEGHTIAPHRINYRANIWALTQGAGAKRVIAVAAVGGIRPDLAPGVLVLPHQIIDYTWGRETTFHESPVVHIDFTHPYDDALRRRLLEAAQGVDQPIADGAVYAVCQGPRLETAAEIDRLERDGVQIVGMTGMPEAALARELGVPYAALAVVANWAAGRADSEQAISMDALEAVLATAMQRVCKVLASYCRIGAEESCS